MRTSEPKISLGALYTEHEKWAGVSSDFGWLLFGLGRPLPGFAYYTLFYSVASAYFPPE